MEVASPEFTHLGRYRVLRELGRGAMGVVYLAEDESLQRQVAVKTLLLPEDDDERENLEARFLQEAKAAGSLNHPGIITIHDLGREGDHLYIAMELLQGTELRDRMASGMLPLHEALDIAAQVAAALGAAHARGVVHRDIKPGNIMLLPDGHAKIMDFGIARMKTSNVRTQSGTMMGSPKYMSPEQVGGHPVDHRSDIFSLGSMLYEMVTGTPAFAGVTLGDLMNAILRAIPASPSSLRAGIPATLEVVIARAMQKNPKARYQDAGEMARELAQIRSTLVARSRDGTTVIQPAPVDPYAATVIGAAVDAEPTLAEGLAPSASFDCAAGLRRLAQSGPLQESAPAQATGSFKWLAWSVAYLVAAAGALAIAFA